MYFDTECNRQVGLAFGKSGIFFFFATWKNIILRNEKPHELLQQVSHEITCSSWPPREHPPLQAYSQHQRPRERLDTVDTVQWEKLQVYCGSRWAFELSMDLSSIRLWGGFLVQTNQHPGLELMQPSLKQERIVHNISRYERRSRRNKIKINKIK